LAGLVCGAVSLCVALFGSLLFSEVMSNGTTGAGLSLLFAAILLATLGLVLAIRGLHSRSRRLMAIVGKALSCVPFALLAGTLWTLLVALSHCGLNCS
jgi:hypothetical protein